MQTVSRTLEKLYVNPAHPARDLQALIVINPGEDTPLYGLYRCMRPERVCFVAVLVRNRVSILATWSQIGNGFYALVLNSLCF